MPKVVTPAVVAVDAGTSRLRISLVALDDGTVLTTASAPTQAHDAELDVDVLWEDLRELASALDATSADIRGVAVAAQLSTTLLDERGRAVRPAMLWGDTRAREEAAMLRRALPPDAARIAGREVAAELAVAKARWVAHHEPQVFARARRLGSLKDALVQRMTERPLVTDATHASYTGLFDVAERAWSDRLVRAAGLDAELLPAVADAADAAGTLAAGPARELGLEPGLPVAVGGPDGTVGAVGAGAVVAGTTVDVAGTTDVLLHVVERVPDGALGGAVVNTHLLPHLWTVGGPTGLTGGAVEWTARTLGFSSAAEAHERLHGADVGSADAPMFLTALGGSRFPTWRPHESGVLMGLRPEHGPREIFAAAQLGAAFTVAEGVDALRAIGAQPDEIVLVGGAARRAETLQLRADACNLPVVALEDPEATTSGAAMLAGVASGAFADVPTAARALVRKAGRCEPRPDQAHALMRARDGWRQRATELFGP